jgi:DNA polymerase-3 subunit delta
VVSVSLPEGTDRDGRPTAVTSSLPVIASMAQELAVTLEGTAAEELAEALDGELGRIRTELEKLATYAGHAKRITAEDVDALVVSDQKSSVWLLADMLAERKRDRALEFLHRLIGEGEQLPGILGGLAWMYRKLIEAQEAPRHIDGWAAAGYLKMRAETAKLALASARRIPREKLMSGLAALYEADSQLKSGRADPRAVMEFLLARLTA